MAVDVWKAVSFSTVFEVALKTTTFGEGQGRLEEDYYSNCEHYLKRNTTRTNSQRLFFVASFNGRARQRVVIIARIEQNRMQCKEHPTHARYDTGRRRGGFVFDLLERNFPLSLPVFLGRQTTIVALTTHAHTHTGVWFSSKGRVS